MVRPDRRAENTQLRAFAASQNILDKADGSAKFDFGNTSVLVSVVGPVEVQIRDEKLDEATVEVVVRPSVGYPTTKEKLMESMLQSAFEPVIMGGIMPRTLLQIVVQIVKDDGAVLAAAVNAVTLGLLDAGIPMKYMASALTCMIHKDSHELVLDPTAEELENASSVHTFAFDNLHHTPHVLLSDSTGRFSEEEYFTSHDTCFEAVDKVQGFLRAAVISKKEKEQQQIVGQ
ncbi:ribosomal protein S5 domain 2-type protein [Phycomyces nitens]|nr:ribosomal protein S5 domain 2-type protein [Phycomyces nitens]